MARKRTVTDEQARDIVRARITKGDAFRLSHDEYQAKQEQIKQTLSGMTKAQLINAYPLDCYDFK